MSFNDLPDISVLLTLDITSLTFRTKKDLLPSDIMDSSPLSDFIIQMGSYLLKYNYFSFVDFFFLLQIG